MEEGEKGHNVNRSFFLGLVVNPMTQLNSVEKDPFAGVGISEKLRVSNAKLFFLYAFILAETLKMHSKL